MSSALGLPLEELFHATDDEEAAAAVSSTSLVFATWHRPFQGIGPHVSPDDRGLTLETGVTWQRLGQVPRHHVDFLLVTYQPGSASSADGRLMRHSDGVRLFDQRRTEADPGLR